MTVLNLREEEPASEATEAPAQDERPPGLDAIRGWLTRPRPWVRGIWLWIRWIFGGIRDGGRYVVKNAPAAAKRVQAIAKKAAPILRAVGKVGQGVRRIGARSAAAADAFRDPSGKNRETETAIRQTGEAAQRYGDRITAAANVAGDVLSVADDVAGVFSDEPPAVAEPREADPIEPPRRVPRTARSATPTAPVPPPPRETSATPLPAETAPSPPPPAKPDEKPAPRATKPLPAEPPPPPPTPSPEPDPSPGDHRPSRTAATPASPTDAAREKRLKGLPRVFHPQALAVGDRPLRETLHALILEICNAREWTTSAELARWFSMHRRSLVQRHLGPLVDAGLLKLRFPDRPRSSRQSYRTNPDRWPPRN